MLFSRHHASPRIRLRLDNTPLNWGFEFKYCNNNEIFDYKCKWKSQATALAAKCGKQVNFLKSVAGSSWGAHPDCHLTIYKTTIRSVLEYGSQCMQFMAKTHRPKLFRLQWRSMRVCLGLMRSAACRPSEPC